jgi:uroporphyrinogen-III synthase
MAARARLLAPGHPLAGASVIVTRPASTAAALRRRVRALGGTPVGLPAIGLRASADADAARRALREAQHSDVVIFVSPAAVRFAWALLPRLHFARATPVLAPGAGSARALQRRGVAGATFPASRQDSEGVLELPALQRVRRRRVALVGAPGGRDLLARELAARGARVQLVEVYLRAPPRLTRRHFAVLESAPAPWISLISSTEALGHLQASLPPALFARLAASDCVVSSARIAARAQALGFAQVHVAPSAAPAALLSAAGAALARHRL